MGRGRPRRDDLARARLRSSRAAHRRPPRILGAFWLGVVVAFQLRIASALTNSAIADAHWGASVSRSLTRAEREHRIHSRRTSHRQPAGEKGDCSEQETDGHQRCGIERAYTITASRRGERRQTAREQLNHSNSRHGFGPNCRAPAVMTLKPITPHTFAPNLPA